MMDAEIRRDFVVANLRGIEEQLLECMEFIPYVAQNQGIISPRFVPILMDACSLIDSVLHDSTERDARHNLKSYAKFLEPRLDLDDATSIFLASPIQLLRPFRGWCTSPPEWWKAYNAVKHDRLHNYPEATYERTVYAVAALHQVVSRSWQFLGNLARAGFFNESSDEFMELHAARAAGTGSPGLPAESKLFVSAIRDTFVDWDTDPPSIEHWEFSSRVKTHIWEWEGW